MPENLVRIGACESCGAQINAAADRECYACIRKGWEARKAREVAHAQAMARPTPSPTTKPTIKPGTSRELTPAEITAMVAAKVGPVAARVNGLRAELNALERLIQGDWVRAQEATGRRFLSAEHAAAAFLAEARKTPGTPVPTSESVADPVAIVRHRLDHIGPDRWANSTDPAMVRYADGIRWIEAEEAATGKPFKSYSAALEAYGRAQRQAAA